MLLKGQTYLNVQNGHKFQISTQVILSKLVVKALLWFRHLRGNEYQLVLGKDLHLHDIL